MELVGQAARWAKLAQRVVVQHDAVILLNRDRGLAALLAIAQAEIQTSLGLTTASGWGLSIDRAI